MGMPVFSMYNTDAATPWKWLAAVATMLLGAAVLRAQSRLVPEHRVAVAEVTLSPVEVGS